MNIRKSISRLRRTRLSAVRMSSKRLPAKTATARHTGKKPGAVRSVQPPSRRATLAMLVFLLSAVVGWYLVFSFEVQEPPSPWRTCLLEESSLVTAGEKTEPAMIKIPAGTYPMPHHTSRLSLFLKPYNMETITIDSTFLLQEQKVTYRQFKRYADFVKNLSPGEEKERRQLHLGLLWKRQTSATSAVQGVSWEAAVDYSHWLSQKTGCHYTIPSRKEWAAAIIHLYNTGEDLPKPNSTFGLTPLKSLLRDGREWTRSSCAMGYYLVGEDNWVSEFNSNQAVCMPPLFSVSGFRVALDPNKHLESHRPFSLPTDSTMKHED